MEWRERSGHCTAVYYASADRSYYETDDRTIDSGTITSDATRKHSGTRADNAERSDVALFPEGIAGNRIREKNRCCTCICFTSIWCMYRSGDDGNPESKICDRTAEIFKSVAPGGHLIIGGYLDAWLFNFVMSYAIRYLYTLGSTRRGKRYRMLYAAEHLWMIFR